MGRRRRTHVLDRDDVVDDETLHPGSMVWLGRPRLDDDELERYELARTRGERPRCTPRR